MLRRAAPPAHNADSGITHGDARPLHCITVGDRLGVDVDAASFGCEFYGVHHQVDQHLPDAQRITVVPDVGLVGRRHRDRDLLGARIRLHDVRGGLDRLTGGTVTRVHLQPPGLDPREVEHFVDEPHEVLSAHADTFEVRLLKGVREPGISSAMRSV